ncbi:hypothetical protein BV22DRAFT_1105333 [Leucogyrophana mollusca]|uniref:Uncharacterized protein n=1 Tax=Leucogyrophana mollusca TaxID=85980 RepID=A0ACB8BG07_9AGAM|nr:hypothetical protein BV22DRAFT_1105333 [Leucogyrophana mollusca]
MEDPAFIALPSHVGRHIDEAFDASATGSSARQSSTQNLRKRRKDVVPQTEGFVAEEAGGFLADEPEAGGFLVEDAEPGGFLIDEEDDSEDSSSYLEAASHLPLSSIPSALRHLDLPSDDEEILSVFRNAASGWGAQSQEGGVSRKDWRSVCAALLDAGDGDNEGDVRELSTPRNANTNDGEGEDSGPDSDDYRMSASDESSSPDQASDEEYVEDSNFASTSRRKATKPRKSSARPASPIGVSKRGLAGHQKARCREDFARFFPGVPDSELDRQKIMIKDITRVATLLKEKLKAEEIVEMLEAFSTSPDKSMSLADFETMMVATKLIKV